MPALQLACLFAPRPPASAGCNPVSAYLDLAAHMQIPAGLQPTGISRKDDRQRVLLPVARQGPARRLKSTVQIYARLFSGQGIHYPRLLTAGALFLKLAFRRILCRRHRAAGDLSHMFSGIGELTSEEFRLNAHGLLKIGGMNQPARMFERGLHVLFGERQRLLGNLRSRARY
jgi:hypothetical protein